MLSQLLTIAKNTFLEAVRQPIFFILIAIQGIAQLLTVWGAGFTMAYTTSAEVSADDKLMVDLSFASIFVIGTLLAAFISTAVLSKEIERKTVLTVVSKPISRPVVVLGKYLGVAGAISIAGLTMLLFFQLGLRHEVMSTASADPDGPVILFTFLAVLISLGVAVWGNFFYNWVFSQTAALLLLPTMAIAFVLVLLIDKDWHFQAIATDFKPQVTLASSLLLGAILVMTAVATAASARLGQVMTLVICAAVFLVGLLSNHFLGSRVYDNTFIAQIQIARPTHPAHTQLDDPRDAYDITFENAPLVTLKPGDPFYYGPFTNGLSMAAHFSPPPKADADTNLTPDQLQQRQISPALIVSQVKPERRFITVERVGKRGPIAIRRPPQEGDFVFLQPTSINPPAMALWGVVPNVQFFWLLDAVSQNQPIPATHVGLILLYALAQIGVFLSLAVILFQRREVG